MAEVKPELHGQKKRDAHALAIGRIAMAWNEYNAILSEIFSDLFSNKNWRMALTAWNSIPSDKTQREVLREVAACKLKEDSPELRELKWLLDATNQIVAAQRNIGIHTNLWSFTDRDGNHEVIPVAHNRRAQKALENTEVLKEYAHYEQQIRKMLVFAVGIQFVLSPRRKGRKVWPTRPTLTKRAA
jgi:hypothetical protein